MSSPTAFKNEKNTDPGHRRRFNRRRAQRGAVMFESLLAICLLGFLFFALLQIYQWSLGQMFCRYSAFYASKAMSLGFQTNLARRGARVAAIAISGAELGNGSSDEELDAQNYMQSGDASGIRYEHWYPQRDGDPEIYLNGRFDGENNSTTVTLRHAPLLAPPLAPLLGVSENPDPAGNVQNHNYSKRYLTE